MEACRSRSRPMAWLYLCAVRADGASRESRAVEASPTPGSRTLGLLHFPIGSVPVMPPTGATALPNSCPAESNRLTLSSTLSGGATMATYLRPATSTGLYVRGSPEENSATMEAVRGLTGPAYPARCDLAYGIGT